ncbi:MAG: adenylosuccinate lyase [Candidatus Njordarchaeia archaeon]
MINYIVHPIDYRYGSNEMRKIFTPENIYRQYALIESTIAEVQAELGIIPKEAVEPIKKAVQEFSYDEVVEEEKKVKHDLVALINVLSRHAQEFGEYIHFGLTSSDIKDTAMSLLIRDGLEILESKLKKLIIILAKKTYHYRLVPCVGRTHGVHANIYSLGYKFGVFASEFLRHLERLAESKKRFLVGKLSGAVGIYTGLGSLGPEIEHRVLKKLGLRIAKFSTQVVSRDIYAELFLLLSLISTSLDKLATEIRNLQRTEILEVEEPFDVKLQVGSSAMPHKRNPIRCENVSSLARILRGLVIPALENIVLWHERDLTNSGSERILLPEFFLLLDEQLNKMIYVIKNLVIHTQRIKKNLSLTHGLIFSEVITMELARRGLGRLQAHRLIRELAQRAINENKNFLELIGNNEEVKKLLDEKTLRELTKPERYLKTIEPIIIDFVKSVEKKFKETIIR